jgi:hypothetical protein
MNDEEDEDVEAAMRDEQGQRIVRSFIHHSSLRLFIAHHPSFSFITPLPHRSSLPLLV